MTSSRMNGVLRHLQRAVIRRDGAGLTDGQLLDGFLTDGEEAAFEALVRRHGPMVLGVCQRVLANPHDAEDAFQATFLVFVRKAASIAQRGLLSNWRYGTAYRTALEARSTRLRRRAREKTVRVMPDVEAPSMNDAWETVRPLLDGELERLPDKYRVPVILCDLEGKTRKRRPGSSLARRHRLRPVGASPHPARPTPRAPWLSVLRRRARGRVGA